jgi:hypothetical protein
LGRRFELINETAIGVRVEIVNRVRDLVHGLNGGRTQAQRRQRIIERLQLRLFASVPDDAAVAAPMALALFVTEATAAGCCGVATGATFAAMAFPFVPAWTPASATASVAAAGVAAAGAGVVAIV